MFNDWQTAGAMQLLEVKNALGEAMISTMGAHVISYKKAGSEDLLFVSEKSYMEFGKPIRGGIPVCWPWFSAFPDASRKLPSHGLARISVWEVKEKSELPDGSSKVVLALPGSRLPDEFSKLDAEIEIIVGSTLKMNLKTVNNGSDNYNLTQAFHTYFAVDDVEKIHIEGLDETEYWNKLDGNIYKQQGDIRINGEVDRIYQNTTAECIIVDEKAARDIFVAKKGSKATVVWNPWIDKSLSMKDFDDEEYHRMICVETANAGNDVVCLQAGASHTISLEIGEK